MEDTWEALQAALTSPELDSGKLPVFLGPEKLIDQPRLPHVVMLPLSDVLSPLTKNKPEALASATGATEYICRATRFDQARDLALTVLGALIPLGGKVDSVIIRYGTETWNNLPVRVARMTVLTPSTVEKTDVTRVRVEQFTQHVFQLPLTILIPQEPTHGPEPEGTTIFEQSP